MELIRKSDAVAAIRAAQYWNPTDKSIAAAAVEAIPDDGGWHKVDNPVDLPPFGQPVIVCRSTGRGIRIESGCLDVNGWWRVYGTRVKRVIAWQPMPDGPSWL